MPLSLPSACRTLGLRTHPLLARNPWDWRFLIAHPPLGGPPPILGRSAMSQPPFGSRRPLGHRTISARTHTANARGMLCALKPCAEGKRLRDNLPA